MAVIVIDSDTIILNGSHKEAYQFERDAKAHFEPVIAAMARRDTQEALRQVENIMRDLGVPGATGFAADVIRHLGKTSPAAHRLSRAMKALGEVEGAAVYGDGDVVEIAADALAELRDPATGRIWEASA